MKLNWINLSIVLLAWTAVTVKITDWYLKKKA
jgi:hypothetical protein